MEQKDRIPHSNRAETSADRLFCEALQCHATADYELAASIFREALRLNPGLVEARLGLSITLADLGRYEEAENTWASAVSQSRSDQPLGGADLARLRCLIGQIYEQTGRLKEAIAEYSQAILDYPTDTAHAHMLLGRARLTSGDRAAGETHLRSAAELGHAEAKAWLGSHLMGSGKLDSGLAYWHEIPKEFAWYGRLSQL